MAFSDTNILALFSLSFTALIIFLLGFSNCKRKIAEGELCFNLFRREEWRHIECFEIPTKKKKFYQGKKSKFLKTCVKDESEESILSSQEGIDLISEELGSKCESFYVKCSQLFPEGNWKQHSNKIHEAEAFTKEVRITKKVADLTDIELAEKLAMFIHNFDDFPNHYREEIRYDLKDMHFWELLEEIQVQEGFGKKKQMLLALFMEQIFRSIAQEAWWKIVFYTGGSYLQYLFDRDGIDLESLDEGDENSDDGMEIGSFDESTEDLDNGSVESSYEESTESSDDKSTENLGQQIRALVRCIPEALSCYDESNEFCANENLYMLPIHSAIVMSVDEGLVSNHSSSMSLFFLLLEEGLKQDIPIAPPAKEDDTDFLERYEDARGGLFSRFDDCEEWSTTLDRLIGCYNYDGSEVESSALDTLKRLKQMELITKDDILDFCLITRAAETRNFSILSWIVSWCPEALKGKAWWQENQLFMHACAAARVDFGLFDAYAFNDTDFPFEKVLKISFQHFPHELGLLFLKDDNETTMDILFGKRGAKESFAILEPTFEKLDQDLYPFVVRETLILFSHMMDLRCDFGTHEKFVQSCILNMLERLKQMQIINKNDILDSSLIASAARWRRFQILRWFLEWYPDGLKTRLEGEHLMHLFASNKFYGYHLDPWSDLVDNTDFQYREFPFEIILDIAFQYFPKELGLLFLENSSKTSTTLSIAYENYVYEHGRKETVWEIIKSAMEKIDPITILTINKRIGMFPFMLAAKGEFADLNMVYYLMRKDPAIWISTA
ncbi:predicted protein [Chaetoceros tenuissimus]|uniref:Uncharacterized protein n=1 Tax=Chaetoceros tenuissimus TaxID=426638 RepID=A0AAD3D2R0_9STRA|nr:predicted protein [Chaetoceros tenuissimus]